MLSVSWPGGSKSLTSYRKVEFCLLSYRFSITPTSSTLMPKCSSLLPLFKLIVTCPFTSSPSYSAIVQIRNNDCGFTYQENWSFVSSPISHLDGGWLPPLNLGKLHIYLTGSAHPKQRTLHNWHAKVTRSWYSRLGSPSPGGLSNWLFVLTSMFDLNNDLSKIIIYLQLNIS